MEVEQQSSGSRGRLEQDTLPFSFIFLTSAWKRVRVFPCLQISDLNLSLIFGNAASYET